MRKIKITIAQIYEQHNLLGIKEIIQKRKDSDLIVFPESTLSIKSLASIKTLQKIVTEYSTSIVIGVIFQNGKRLYDYSYYISPEKIERYQKIHVHWVENHVPGKEFRVVKTPFGKIGLLICFDAAFQESGRVLAMMGAEMIVIIHAIPAHFPYRVNLLRSQSIALNNQLYVIDSCKPGRNFTGHGAIFDPYGKKLMEQGKYQSIMTRTIDMDVVAIWRKKEKIFPYRKPRLYKAISSNGCPV
ncbi:carbon-nitrogen hydrolase family protein [Candidatus Woesearchaeota archaeon]|nr:carbon-nitrogen hydrolase family protein [Candidatus Woesearchaeota archaeon]